MRSLPPSRRVSAFTLVELLIVIGIIAVLVALLLPALEKIREQGKQVTCASNLNHLGTAMLLYAADNDNSLPATSRTGAPANQRPNDWIWWQPNPRVNTYKDLTVTKSAIAKYLNLTAKNVIILRCPSDNWDYRPAPLTAAFGAYPYSYVMSWFIAGDSNLPAAGVTGQQSYQGPSPGICRTLLKVISPSQKILMYEEDQQTINDGNGQPWLGTSGTFDPNDPTKTSGTVGGPIDLLALRHEWSRAGQLTNGVPTKSTAGTWKSAVPNPDARGNVVFCDGHSEFVSRAFAHRPDHTIGNQ